MLQDLHGLSSSATDLSVVTLCVTVTRARGFVENKLPICEHIMPRLQEVLKCDHAGALGAELPHLRPRQGYSGYSKLLSEMRFLPALLQRAAPMSSHDRCIGEPICHDSAQLLAAGPVWI